jgi:hypothetical protein
MLTHLFMFMFMQDLIKAAAEQGSAEVMGILLSQPLFKKDEDELDEAVDTGRCWLPAARQPTAALACGRPTHLPHCCSLMLLNTSLGGHTHDSTPCFACC